MGSIICCDKDDVIDGKIILLYLQVDKLKIQFIIHNDEYKLIYHNNGNIFHDNKLELYGDDLIIFKTPINDRIILTKEKNQWFIFIHRDNSLIYKSRMNMLINKLRFPQ